MKIIKIYESTKVPYFNPLDIMTMEDYLFYSIWSGKKDTINSKFIIDQKNWLKF